MPKKQSQLTAATAANDEDEMNMVQAGTSKRVRRDLVAPLPMNYIAGLITAIGTDTEHDIDIAVGVARDNTDVDNMRLAAILTKQIDAAWAVGTDQGGLDTGAVAADTMYAIWLIKRSDTGVVDALFSTSFTAPTMPADYDEKRLIAAIRTNAGSNIFAYIQSGDYFRYTGDVMQDVNDNTIVAASFETGTLSVPPLALAHIYGHLTNITTTDTDGSLYIRTKGAADSGSAPVESWGHQGVAGATFVRLNNIGMVLVDVNKQVEYTASEGDGTATVFVYTLGFTMLTRRDP